MPGQQKENTLRKTEATEKQLQPHHYKTQTKKKTAKTGQKESPAKFKYGKRRIAEWGTQPGSGIVLGKNTKKPPDGSPASLPRTNVPTSEVLS